MRLAEPFRIAVLGLLVAGACLSLLQGLNNAVLSETGSLDNQWGPSRALLNRVDTYAAFLAGEKPSNLIYISNYPASGLVFLWPYAWCDWPTAKLLWALSNVLFTAVIVGCLWRLLPRGTPGTVAVLLVSLFVMGTPWRNGVGNGQHALFVLAFLLLSIRALPRSLALGGIALAVSWFKHTLTFPLSLYFVRSKRGWKAVAVAAGIHAALTCSVAAWVRSPPHRLLLGPIEVAKTDTGVGYLDVFAVGAALGLSSPLLPGMAALVILVITCAAMRHDDDALSCLSMLSVAALAMCYHRPYDFVLLVIPLAYALRERGRNARSRLYLLLISMTWFVDRAVDVVASRGWFGPGARVHAAFFWPAVLVFYGVLVTDWSVAFPRRRATPEGQLNGV